MPAKWIAITFAVLLGLIAFLVSAPYVKVTLDNWLYASSVFMNVVRYDRVIASRRWHPLEFPPLPTFGGTYGCTYAIVELSPDAERDPPRSEERRHWAYVFRRDTWKPTPGPEVTYTGDSGWIECRIALGQSVFDRVATASTTPGGFWDQRGDTLFLYSPSTGLAARMRQGE